MGMFDICKGNMGAMSFVAEAFNLSPIEAIGAFTKMSQSHIEGDKLYMLWNDCLDRDTARAIKVMLFVPIEEIERHINYDAGRGIPFTEDELVEQGVILGFPPKISGDTE